MGLYGIGRVQKVSLGFKPSKGKKILSGLFSKLACVITLVLQRLPTCIKRAFKRVHLALLFSQSLKKEKKKNNENTNTTTKDGE